MRPGTGPWAAWPLLALAVLLPVPVALAQDRVAVRVGDHPGRGRVVFDWPAPPSYTVDQAEGRVVLRFPSDATIDLAGARRPPRNVVGVTLAAEGVSIGLRPGVRVQVFRIGPKVVVDVSDPPAGAPPAQPQAVEAAPPRAAPASRLASAEAAPSPKPASRPEPAIRLETARRGRTLRTEAPPPAPPATPLPPVAALAAVPPVVAYAAPPPAVAEATAPPGIALPRPTALVVRLLAPSGQTRSDQNPLGQNQPSQNQPSQNRAILLSYPATTGAAVLRRGGQLLALFDSAEPLDLSALRNDPIFGALEADALPDATLLRLPLAPPAILRARREAAGWVLEATRPAEGQDAVTAVPGRSMALEAEGGAASRLIIRATQPGRAVPVTDPESGMPLILGTVREARQFMPVARRLPELDLPQTLLGAAVLARADRLTMRAGTDQFLIGIGNGRLALDLAAAEAAPSDAMTRVFDLPRLPPAQLLERLRALNASIANAPPLTRLPLRRSAGETMLALGLPQEAQAMLGLAPGEDPHAATDQRLAMLVSAAALLAGRLPQAMALLDPELPESDELTLWRAALAAAQGNAAAAAPGFATTLPLLFDYPAGLRARLLPLAAQALADGGATVALKQLLGRAGPLPELDLPRAMLAEAEGNADAALAGYDQVAQGRDRQARARALRQAVELRLATGKLDAGQAAKALGATLFAWRGDSEEAKLRLRVAELRRKSGDARGALALLRETEVLFPERAVGLQPEIGTAFLAALDQEAPLAAVALFDAYPELLPADQRGEAAMLMLADRLLALDLADRAATLLGQAAARATGTAKAALGLREANLRLVDGDAAATLAALETSAADSLPDVLVQERSILAARAQARLGQQEEAIAALRGLGPVGLETLSQLLADQQDWAGAAAAFGPHLALTLPVAPAALNEQQRRLILRQATLLALAGDEAGLADLRGEFAARLQDGPLAEAFALITAKQLRGLADLPRLQRELQLFRSMPSRLEALRAGGPVTR
ncbi:MAG: hypothetical protein JWP04_267 [Belnapia sp.]|nr:hypothetical protein [Belnapia sp.]